MGIKISVADSENKNRAPWWWRRRIGLTPFYFGLLSAFSGWASFLLSVGQMALVVGSVSLAAAWGAERKWGRKKDRAQRNFVWAVIFAWALFVGAVRVNALSPGWLFAALVLGVIGLGAFWWADLYNLERVKVERDQERWPMLAKRLSMPQVQRGPVKKTESGRRWTFWWLPGEYTTSAFRNQRHALESALGIPENRLRFEAVYEGDGLKNPNAIVVTENTESMISKGSIVFDKPTMQSICDPMFIGYREDGSRHEVVWFHREFGGMHTLAAGSTGSGKSGLYNLVMADGVYANDIVRWGIDAKGGMALRPWASTFDWVVDDVDGDEVRMMFKALLAILIGRSKYAASRGWDCWEPDADHPVLIMIIDEAAEVLGVSNYEINDLTSSIARMGRAAGVLLLVATQHPTNEAIGSNQLMKNLRRRFCFSVEDHHAQRIIIPKSSELFDATEIPVGPQFAGTYYSSEGGQISPLSGRVRYVSRDDIYRLVMTVGHDPNLAVPGLDERSEGWASSGSTDDEGHSYYDARRIWTVKDVIKPKGWVDQGDEPWLVHQGLRLVKGEPVDEPTTPAADEPVMAFSDAPPGAPGYIPPDPYAMPPAPDAPAAEPEPEGTPKMNLSDLVQPRTDAEEEELQSAVAAYAAQHAEGNVSPEQAQGMLDSMLDQAGGGGLAIADMRQVLGRSASWFSAELAKRIKANPPQVEKVGTRYRRPGAPLRAVRDVSHSE